MLRDSTSTTTTIRAPLGGGTARPADARTADKPAATAAKRTGGSAKPAATAKPANRPKTAISPKRPGTHSGRLTIAILAGVALGLVCLLIYGFAKPAGPWAFDRPEAQLPSLQAKHTLY
jgi:hypothetical protein